MLAGTSLLQGSFSVIYWHKIEKKLDEMCASHERSHKNRIEHNQPSVVIWETFISVVCSM
jgi:hypothetical protein